MSAATHTLTTYRSLTDLNLWKAECSCGWMQCGYADQGFAERAKAHAEQREWERVDPAEMERAS